MAQIPTISRRTFWKPTFLSNANLGTQRKNLTEDHPSGPILRRKSQLGINAAASKAIEIKRRSAVGMTEQTESERQSERPERPFSRRKPTRLRPSIEDTLVQIKAHKGFVTPAALALGVSRGVLDRMISRSSRLSYACHQERGGLTDFAEQQLFKRIAAGDTKAICFALSSKWGQARGYAPKGTEFNGGDQPRVTNFNIKFITPESLKAERAGKVIEHQAAVEDNWTEDSSGQ
jgi:hypothetical protein